MNWQKLVTKLVTHIQHSYSTTASQWSGICRGGVHELTTPTDHTLLPTAQLAKLLCCPGSQCLCPLHT